MKIAIFCLAAAGLIFTGCGLKLTESANTNAASSVASPPASVPSATPPHVVPTTDAKATKQPQLCGAVTEPGKKFIAEQSFPFDYEPFRGSCFVTFGNLKEMVDETDVPRGSTFHIYKDGKQVFQFPAALGYDDWVEAAAFEDLNGDGLTDVIIAGRWLGTNFSAPINVVYVNTGTTFTTNTEANKKLDKLKSIAAIKKAVKRDLKSFF